MTRAAARVCQQIVSTVCGCADSRDEWMQQHPGQLEELLRMLEQRVDGDAEHAEQLDETSEDDANIDNEAEPLEVAALEAFCALVRPVEDDPGCTMAIVPLVRSAHGDDQSPECHRDVWGGWCTELARRLASAATEDCDAHPRTTELLCKAIRNVAVLPGRADALVGAARVHESIAAILLRTGSAGVIRWACSATTNLMSARSLNAVSATTTISLLLESECRLCEAVVLHASGTTATQSVLTARAVTAALCQLAQHPMGKRSVVAAGICSSLPRHLLAVPDATVAGRSCLLVFLLALHNDPFRHFLLEQGVAEGVAHALEVHAARSVCVAQNGSMALGALAEGDRAFRVRLARSGAGTALVTHVLRVHGTIHAVVARDACLALAAVASDSPVADRRQLWDAGALEVVVLVLRRHAPHDARTALCACQALTQLVRFSAGATLQRLLAAGTCEALTDELLKRYSSSTEDRLLVHCACWAAMKLAASAPAAAARLGDAGVCELLLQVCARHRTRIRTLCVAVRCLSLLASAPENKVRLRHAGVRDALQMVLAIVRAAEAGTPRIDHPAQQAQHAAYDDNLHESSRLERYRLIANVKECWRACCLPILPSATSDQHLHDRFRCRPCLPS